MNKIKENEILITQEKLTDEALAELEAEIEKNEMNNLFGLNIYVPI